MWSLCRRQPIAHRYVSGFEKHSVADDLRFHKPCRALCGAFSIEVVVYRSFCFPCRRISDPTTFPFLNGHEVRLYPQSTQGSIVFGIRHKRTRGAGSRVLRISVPYYFLPPFPPALPLLPALRRITSPRYRIPLPLYGSGLRMERIMAAV